MMNDRKKNMIEIINMVIKNKNLKLIEN